MQELVQNFGEGDPINHTFNYVFWFMMAFNLIAIAFSKTLNRGYLATLFKAALSNRQLMNNVREDIDIWKATSILLNLAYFHCIAIIIWMAIGLKEGLYIFYIALILIGISIVKLFVIRIISFITQGSNGTLEHLHNHFVFYQLGGVILTPILIFTHYVPVSYVTIVLIIIASISGFLLLVREFQSLTQAFQYKISIFYIILYLCTLEIMPLLVGLRVFILNNGL